MRRLGLLTLVLVIGPWAFLASTGAAWPILLLGVGYGGGWLVGRRSGRREATYDAAREIVRGSNATAFRLMDWRDQ